MQELLHHYPNKKAIVDSTLAACLNGYTAGFGTLQQLRKEINLYGNQMFDSALPPFEKLLQKPLFLTALFLNGNVAQN